MTTVKVVVLLELSNDGLFDAVPTKNELHELLCKAFHEDDKQALADLQDFITDIGIVQYTEVQQG